MFLVQPLCFTPGPGGAGEQCAIYARETEAAGDVLSQVDLCLDAAKRFAWSPSEDLLFVDAASVSNEADLDGRCALAAMLQASLRDEDPFVYLLIAHLSALSEHLHVAHALVNLFVARGLIVCIASHEHQHGGALRPPIVMCL